MAMGGMRTGIALLVLAIGAGPAAAQASSGAGPSPAAAAGRHASATGTAAAKGVDPDRLFNPAQPDYTVVALPTTLRLARGASAFRVTHRFTRAVNEGDFGSFVENFFGFDSGALIGLEYRRGIRRGLQAGVYRTSDRTIQVFALQSIRTQRDGALFGLTALVAIDGTNNFRDEYRPAIGAIVSRELRDRAALYVQPVWVGNTNLLPADLAADNHTLLVGVGARLRVRPTVYLVAEAAPRAAGFAPGADQVSLGIEKRAGGHMFQLTVQNGFGTTPGQLARGAIGSDRWYLGFSISRRFQ